MVAAVVQLLLALLRPRQSEPRQTTVPRVTRLQTAHTAAESLTGDATRWEFEHARLTRRAVLLHYSRRSMSSSAAHPSRIHVPRGEVKQVPERFDGTDVAIILSGIGRCEEKLRAPKVADHSEVSPKHVQHAHCRLAPVSVQRAGAANWSRHRRASLEPGPANTARRQAPAPDLQTCRERVRVTAEARVIRASRFQRTRLERRGEIHYRVS